MYPRNAASPEPIAIGAVIQISDGAVQSSGVTVRIKPVGVSEADGAGTTAYSTDGVVLYTPTQAETNYTSFVLIAKKTGCIPASVTVVTSASNVAGHAGTDHSKIQNAGSTVNLSGTTIKTATDIESDTQDIQSRLPAALVDGRMVSVAQVVSDKTGYKLASDGLALVTDWTVNITGDLIGDVTGSVGSVNGVTFPANFGVLVIDPSGNIETVNTVLELDENALTADDAGLPIAGYVWDAQYSQHTTAGTFGKLFDIWRKSNPAIEGTIQASPSPTTTVFKTDVDYPTGAFKHSVLFFADDASIPFQNSPILTVVNNGDGTSMITIEEDTTAAPVAGDKFFIIPSNHVHAIAAIVDAVMGQATSTSNYNAGDVGYVLRQLYSMIEADGADWRYTANALEQAPAGGGGGGGTDWTSDERTAIRSIFGIPASGTTPTDPSVGILDEIRDGINGIGINVYPVSASTPERVAGTTLTFYRDESRSVSVVTDFTLTSLTLEFVVEDQDGVDVYTLADGSISRSNQTFTVAITTAVTAGLGQYRWSIRDVTGGGSSVIAMGVLTVQEAASNA